MRPLLLLILLAVIGCKNDTVEKPTGSVTFSLNHQANGQNAIFDSIMYQIPTGYMLSLTRWEYYISGIELLDAAGKTIYSNVNAHYINGRYADTWDYTMTKVPTGSIKKIKLTIGLVPEINVSGGLPNTAENIGMAWPDVMGGGYHFMKLEGHFRKTGAPAGYAMHIGNNGYQVNLVLDHEFTVKEGETTLHMDIDAMEWFKNPNDFDFEIDGNYTMGIPALMLKLTENGQTVITKIY